MDKKQIIEDCLKQCLTTKEIGKKLGGVSRQRVYQLMQKYGLSTPERKKLGFWKDQDPKLKWLNRTMLSRGLSFQERHALIDELKDKMPDFCPVLGTPMIYGNEGIRQDNSASIDRYDSTKPYEPGNVAIISWRANRIKNDGTLEEHERLVAWMKENIRS
jgi:hypothetical protein